MIQKSFVKNDKGKLYLVPTPIGNMDDITLRGIKILKSVDYIYAEDTRVTLNLLSFFDIKKKVFSCHKYSEEKNKFSIIDKLNYGFDIAYVSDRGTPSISDPGEIIVKEAIKNNIDVIMDHTMTFAIPVEEIKKASQEYDKKNELDFSVLLCSDFMQREGIIDEKTFGEFLIRYGASSKLVNTIISSSNYVAFLKEKENCKIHFKNKELYIPTTENDNHTLKIIINDDQTFSVVSCEYSNFMDSGLRYGSASVLDFYLKEDGTVLLNESVSKLSEVTDITPEMILPVYNVYARKQSIEYDINNPKVLALEEVSLIATRDEGKLISSNIDEKYKMDKARTLGFDEKYYTKKKIAGLNKYSDGREVYMTEEDLEELDETGYIVSNEAVLVKTSGKVNVLLVSMIVGFVIGIGIAFSLFIINIG